jgi:transcriptional regulator with XRE-family HTH domain
VDPSSDIAELLNSRRARVTPEQAGLPSGPTHPRRVQGLRREEVASLAGVSVEHYRRLERVNAAGVSEIVLEALARALQLDDAERAQPGSNSAEALDLLASWTATPAHATTPIDE